MKKNILLTSILATFAAGAASTADEQTQEIQSLDQINFAYAGDQTRIGIGIDENGDFIADFLKSFNSTYRSNWIGQGWYNDGAGGVELDYHWVSGATSEDDLINNGNNYHVNKLFFALDQNTFHDRKFTFGGGREVDDKFWSVNASKSITGTRLISNTSIFTDTVLNGMLGNHETTQLQTIEDITRIYEHPYEWGVGGRIGKYFDNNLVRLTGGLDYESGDFSSNQLTASVDVEKYFANTGHSVALHVEHNNREGDFALDKNDTRAFLMYRYDFGKTYQPTERYEEVKVVDEEALALLKEEKRQVVQNSIDLSSMAFFNLDSAELRADTKSVLLDVVNKIKSKELASKITIIGHTCSIGKESYNQGLSERRANAAKQFFIDNGLEGSLLLASGKGETEPAFDNNGPDIAKNRRVAVSFLTIEKSYKDVEISPEEVPVKWIKQPIKIAPSWLARALHNPAKHKRTVDVYQYQEKDSVTTLGDVIVLNVAPIAADDDLTILRNASPVLIDVLNNDSDAENDGLTIANVIQPANGVVVNNGDSLTYTPNPGFIGSDSFTYTIDDGNGDQATASVKVNVLNNAPNAGDDSAIATGSQPVVIDVIGNDVDSDGTRLVVKSVTQGQNGSVTNNEDGTVTYQANNDFVGIDTFTYIVSDEDGGESVGTVTVVVEEDNEAPVAADDLYMVMYGGALNFNPLENDTDPDGDSINLVSVDTSSLQGTLTVNDDGSMRYVAPRGYFGEDTFTYIITDGNGETATATVVMCVAD